MLDLAKKKISKVGKTETISLKNDVTTLCTIGTTLRLKCRERDDDEDVRLDFFGGRPRCPRTLGFPI